MICVGFSINCLYPNDDLRLPISEPIKLVTSLFHHLEHPTLKNPVKIEHGENSSLMLPYTLSDLSVMVLARGYKRRLKNIFHIHKPVSVTRHLQRVHISSYLMKRAYS